MQMYELSAPRASYSINNTAGILQKKPQKNLRAPI